MVRFTEQRRYPEASRWMTDNADHGAQSTIENRRCFLAHREDVEHTRFVRLTGYNDIRKAVA